jgi:hypothetical protein
VPSSGAGFSAAVSPTGGIPAPIACPHCGALNDADHLFCESCGYDFTTGQSPEAPAPVAPLPTESGPAPAAWVVVVEVDPAWFALKGELSDQACPSPSTSTVTVSNHVALIGRTSQSRNLRPEIALDSDAAVSRRHAQLLLDGTQLSIVDLSSTNGTYVVGGTEAPTDDLHPLVSGVPAVLHDGDRIYLGAWSRLTVRST